MIVNPGVARFQQHAHETLAQMQDTLRTFQRVVGPSCRTHLTFLIEAMRQRVGLPSVARQTTVACTSSKA